MTTLIPDRRTTSVFKDVREFLATSQPGMMHALGEPIRPDVADLAWKLIDEEVNKELKEDLQKFINGNFSLETLARVFDHYLDIIYVAVWALEAFGLPSQAGWNEIQRANMSKFPEVHPDDPLQIPHKLDILEYDNIVPNARKHNGRWILTNPNTGKVIKPRGFLPPDIWGVLNGMLAINICKTQHDIIATPFMKNYFHTMEERISNDK